MAKLARRELGTTEKNWCLALEGGTGVTVSAFLFGIPLSKSTVQRAVNELLAAKPFLATQIVSESNNLFFEVSEQTVPVEEVAIPFAGKVDQSFADEEEEEEAPELWLKIVDWEQNLPFPKNGAKPVPITQVHLYRDLPDSSSLVVIRNHAGACDIASCPVVGSTFLNVLKTVVEKEVVSEGGDVKGLEEDLKKLSLSKDVLENFKYSESLEKSIPKGAANKPFWAQGTDMVGYGIAGKRQEYLPFRDVEKPRKSRLIRASLSKEATDRLLEACKENSTDLYGALYAAGLKSAATFKKLGNRQARICYAVLHNCRSILDPALPPDAIGFYQAALLKTGQISENDDFWKTAANSSSDFADAIKKRKHFTDMGNLNTLMVQAIHHPNLTPHSTIRTSCFSLPHDPAIETTPAEAAEALKLQNYVTTSSVGGVGPCVALFPFFRDGALSISFGYCYPLFSRKDIQTIIDSIWGYITV